MQLDINEQIYEVPDEPDRPLLWVLRDELGLTGTKFGCGIGVCGSCVVHLDGTPVRSCVTPISSVGSKVVCTIEGLAETTDEGETILHPVQQAFLDEQAPQCGYCMSGQIMTAAALLEDNQNPDDDTIKNTMSAVYCRCGAYDRVRKAVKHAAEEIGS
jgi:isoquinoline 1-oxidoreductase subunit alpha